MEIYDETRVVKNEIKYKSVVEAAEQQNPYDFLQSIG